MKNVLLSTALVLLFMVAIEPPKYGVWGSAILRGIALGVAIILMDNRYERAEP